jgi:xylulokinase
VLAEAERPLALETPEPLAAEQDAEAWWAAAADTLRELSAGRGERVAAVGLTGQKHALLPLDAANRPLSRAVLWADGRASAEAVEVVRRVPRAALSRRTGALALPGYLVPKWLRMRALEPEKARATARLVFAKDFVRLRLTGVFATDPTEASASLLYEIGSKRWADDLLAAFEVPAGALPAVVRCDRVAGRVSAEAAAQTGLPEGTPVAAGAGDNEAGAVGCGAVTEGRVAVVLGTSGTVVAPHARHGPVGGLVWGRHATRTGYAATGVVLSAGRALEWLRSAAFPRDMTTDEVLAAAQASDPVEGPLVFLPSLAGERSPVPDPGASGAFVGLRPGHTRGHLARAALEGVAIALAEVCGLLRGAGVRVDELRLTGGGAESPFWRGLLAAAAGTRVRHAGGAGGPAFGAAALAASAARRASVEEVCEAWISPPPAEEPDAGEVERLRGLATAFRAVRNALRSVSATGRASPPA